MVGYLGLFANCITYYDDCFPFVFDEKFGRTSALEQILTALFPFIYLAYSSYFQLNKVDRFMVDDPKAKKESFLGSITFAVVFATIIHAFVTQPFAIPTGSMERTLLVGDFIRKQMELWLQNANETSCFAILQGTIMDTRKMEILKRPKILCRCY